MKKIVYELQNSNSQFAGKNLKKLIATLFIIVAASCSKDDSVVNKYRLIEDSELETKFQYDAQGRLVKETDLAGLEKCSYMYNSQNQLITYVWKNFTDNTTTTEDFIYNSTGKLAIKISVPKNSSNIAISKNKYDYLYNSNSQLYQVKTSIWNNAAGTYINEGILYNYTYDSNNRLNVNNSLQDYTYDSNSNVIKLAGVGKNGTPFTIQYTYDDKINPYYNLRPLVTPNNEIINAKNTASEIITGTFANTYNFQYEYNDGGYPTKKTSSQGIVYKYEKIN
jgi:YD repeat-containing protein